MTPLLSRVSVRNGAIPSRGGLPPTNSCRDLCPSRPDGRYTKASVLEIAQGLVVELGDNLQLDEVHPSLTTFNLCDKAWGSPEFLGYLPLSEIRVASRLLELSAESAIGRTVKGVRCFWHWLPLLDKQAYNPGMLAPKIGATRDARCC